MLDLEGFSCTFIWCVHENFSPLRLRENQRASFSVDRSNSWFSRTMSSDKTLLSPVCLSSMPLSRGHITLYREASNRDVLCSVWVL